jgi:hypothetical protein
VHIREGTEEEGTHSSKAEVEKPAFKVHSLIQRKFERGIDSFLASLRSNAALGRNLVADLDGFVDYGRGGAAVLLGRLDDSADEAPVGGFLGSEVAAG